MSEEHNIGTTFYTVEEVAKKFRVGRTTVLNWIKKHEIKARKIGRRWFIYGI